MPASKKYVRCVNGFMLHDRTIVKGGQVLAANDRVVKDMKPADRERHFIELDDDEQVDDATVPDTERTSTGRKHADTVVASSSKKPAKRTAKPAPAPAAEPNDTSTEDDD